MDKLVDQFIFTLKERGFAQSTQDEYVYIIKRFFRDLGKDPLEASQEDVRKYQVYLLDKKYAPRSVNLNLAAIRFFYLKTLRRDWPPSFVPWVKQGRRLPTVWSMEEVAKLINSAANFKHRVILMATYAGGLRSCEVVRLKPSDIDSKRMLIHVLGKGNKERFVMLPRRFSSRCGTTGSGTRARINPYGFSLGGRITPSPIREARCDVSLEQPRNGRA